MSKEDLALLKGFERIGRAIKEAEESEREQVTHHLQHTCDNDEERLEFMIKIAKLYGVEEKDFKEEYGIGYDYFEQRKE